MITLLHGEDSVRSLEKLWQLKSEAKLAGCEVREIDASKTSKPAWEQFFNEQSMFGDALLVVLNYSGAKDLDEKFLIGNSTDIIIHEKKKLYATPSIPGLKVERFDLEQIIFDFLDGLAPGEQKAFLPIWKELLRHQPAEMLITMIGRQMRLLLLMKDNCQDGPKEWLDIAWQKKKLGSQANKFTREHMVDLHNRLLRIDFNNKSGKSILNLADQLELWLISV